MTEIRLIKKYPHIKDEDVISIFQEGYTKGFENGRKGAIPIEWIEQWKKTEFEKGNIDWVNGLNYLLSDWREENEID